MIHFRTRLEGTTLSSKSYWSARGRSTEIRWLREYSVWDDPRDIAWKRGSSPRGLYTKEREDAYNPPILLISLISRLSGSYTSDPSIPSKWQWKDTLSREISLSTASLRIPYSEIDIFSERTVPFEKSLIFLLIDIESYEDFARIDTMIFEQKNDIILIFLLHPDELPYTHTSILYESHTIASTYKKKYDTLINELYATSSRRWISPVVANTSEDPTLLLNHFFKYRYVR